MHFLTGKFHPRCSARLAVGLASLIAMPAMAADLGPGESAVVEPGQAAEHWYLEQDARLTLQPGAQSHNIYAFGDAVVTLTGARVTSTPNPIDYPSDRERVAVQVINADVFINDSTVSAAKAGALSVVTTEFFEGRPATAILENSQVMGNTYGVSVESADLEVSRSAVSGGRVGIEMADGKMQLRDGTEVIGDVGIELRAAEFFSTPLGNQVLVDGSTIEGRNGSAIRVKADNLGEPTEADIVIGNGAKLKASNGVLVQVDEGADVGVLVANSHLTGQLINLNRLALTDGAHWTMTGNAQVGALSLNHGSIEMGGGAAGYRQLAIDSLAGTGQFEMAVDLAAREGDVLKVTGNATGVFDLKIANTGLEPTAGGPSLKVVETGGGDAQFAVLGGQVEAGAHAYDLQRQGDDWALVQKIDRHGRAVQSASTRSVLGLYNAAPVVWRSELAGLRSRFDELRREPMATGVWLRTQGARYSIRQADAQSYDLRQNGLTLGVDFNLTEQVAVGLLAGTSRSALDFSQGTRGLIDSGYLGAYAGWTDVSGLYIDALVKANRFSNRADVQMSDGVKARGKYHDIGMGAALELGRRIEVAEGWYLKPYGQLTALAMQGQDYRLSNGMQASSNAARSLTGKLGSQFGRTLAMAGGGTLQPYVKVAASREFADSNRANINGRQFDNSLAGSGLELGTGFTAQLTPDWQLAADFDWASGQRIDQAYGVSAGLRYAF